MKNKYYAEAVEKDTQSRADYLQGIETFLFREKEDMDKKRNMFINPELYKKNSEGYREKLIDMLGFPLREQRVNPTVEKTFVAEDCNVNIYRMTFTFFNDLKFYGIYFEQIEKSNKTPFIFGFHGGDGTPELISSMHYNSSNYNHLVRRMTDMGANVFVPQFLLWNIDLYGNSYNRLRIDGKLRQLGGSITAMELYLLQCSLDYFIQSEEINEDKIGVAGLSYGGMYAIHFAAIETRVKACYSCSWVNDCFVNSWADWSYFNAQKYFTTAETMALIAPRPLIVAMGKEDPLFPSTLTREECERVKPYYAILKADDNFQYLLFDGKHEADKDNTELEFLFQNLIGE